MAKEAHGWTRPPPHTWNLLPKCDVTGKRQSFHCRKKQRSTHSPCSPERSKVTASAPALDFWKGKKETHLNSGSAQFCPFPSSHLFISRLKLAEMWRQCVCWGRGCFEAFPAFRCPPGLFYLVFCEVVLNLNLESIIFLFIYFFILWFGGKSFSNR